MLQIAEISWRLIWGVKPLLQRNLCHNSVRWLLAPPLTLGDQVRLGKIQRISPYQLSLSNKCKNNFHTMKKIVSSPLRKMRHLKITMNIIHCRIASQVNILEKIDIEFTSSINHPHTSTSVISPITDVRSPISPINQPAVPLSNKRQKQVFYQAITANGQPRNKTQSQVPQVTINSKAT